MRNDRISDGKPLNGRHTVLYHESLKAGGGPQGILTVRPELLVPFVGEWAA
jgi:hypothetical protein